MAAKSAQVFNQLWRLRSQQPPQLHTGFASTQQNESYCASEIFPDECILFAQGFGDKKQEIVTEILSTVLLAYTIQRKKRFYSEAKEHLIKQLFKIAAKKVLKTSGLHDSRAHLVILCSSARSWWWGILGDLRIYLYRDRTLTGFTQKTDGIELMFGQTLTVHPTLYREVALRNDRFIIATPDLLATLNEKRLSQQLTEAFSAELQLKSCADQLLYEAIKRRKQAQYAVLLVERV